MAGSVAASSADIGGGFTKYTIAWTSDAAGAVSGNTVDVKRGHLRQVKYKPDAGGTQPTDLYDVTLLDADGADLLAGGGANLSNVNASIAVPTAPILLEGQSVTPTVANAGNAKGGTIILYVGP